MESKFARIGRTYPRPIAEAKPSGGGRVARRYRITAALIAVLSALGLIGWLLGR